MNDADDLRRSTRETFDECRVQIDYIEAHPIAHDATYTEILKSSRGAFDQAFRAMRTLARDPYGANPPIVLALTHLKAQREMLDRLLAQDAENPTIAAIANLKTDVAAVGSDAKRGADAAESADRKIKAPRADIGSKHHQRQHISHAWKLAKDVAADFNKSAFMPKHGKRKLGTCDEAKVNRWDAKYHDYEHRNRWGYYAQLRIRFDRDSQNEYYEVLSRWAEHWEDYKRWARRHPGVKFRPMRRTDIDTARMGRDEQGDLVIEPRPDPRRA